MGSFGHLIVLVLVTAVVHVSATRFCQCENSSFGRIFPGINQICRDLSADWCSTNCNTAGRNCDYCQFKPAGTGNDEDYARLKAWCSSQTAYDSSSQTSYAGTSVECYSARNAASQPTLDFFGCRHQDNGDFAPKQPAPANPDQATTKPAPRGATDVNFYSTVSKNLRLTGHNCDYIYPSAANKIKDQFLAEHTDCSVDSNRSQSPGVNYLRCPYTSENVVATYEKDLDILCETLGGGEESEDIPLVG